MSHTVLVCDDAIFMRTMISDILAQAGMTFDHVVASRVYITDGTKFQEMNKTYTTYFTSKPPARATVIAPLMGPQYLVEITLTASSLPKVDLARMSDGLGKAD